MSSNINNSLKPIYYAILIGIEYLLTKRIGNSLKEFQWLLNAIASTLSELNEQEQPTVILKNGQEKSIEPTMTIWGTDPLSSQQTKKLLLFIDTIGRNQCYTDTSADVKPKSTTIQSTLFSTTSLSDKVFRRCIKWHIFSKILVNMKVILNVFLSFSFR